jgi:hypothetical protein
LVACRRENETQKSASRERREKESGRRKKQTGIGNEGSQKHEIHAEVNLVT